jgi:hypothetical protein
MCKKSRGWFIAVWKEMCVCCHFKEAVKTTFRPLANFFLRTRLGVMLNVLTNINTVWRVP